MSCVNWVCWIITKSYYTCEWKGLDSVFWQYKIICDEKKTLLSRLIKRWRIHSVFSPRFSFALLTAIASLIHTNGCTALTSLVLVLCNKLGFLYEVLHERRWSLRVALKHKSGTRASAFCWSIQFWSHILFNGWLIKVCKRQTFCDAFELKWQNRN